MKKWLPPHKIVNYRKCADYAISMQSANWSQRRPFKGWQDLSTETVDKSVNFSLE